MKKLIPILLALALFLLPVSAEVDYGTVEGSTYWNDTLSIGLTLNENWKFLTMEELNEMMGGMDAEATVDTIVMYAMDPNTMTTIMMSFVENTDDLDLMPFLSVREEDYTESGINVLENVDMEYEVAGETCQGHRLVTGMGGLRIYCLTVAVEGEDYVTLMTITGLEKDTTEAYLGGVITEKP